MNGYYTVRFVVACVLLALLVVLDVWLIDRGLATGFAPFNAIAAAVLGLLAVGRMPRHGGRT